jgi:hypothetical protein
MPKRVGHPGGKLHPISKADIEHAQKNTKSNMEAARFLGVGYPRYKRYAKIYNLFDSHMNPTGIGTPKGFGAKASSIKLKDIFANKYLGYSLIKLKHRMIARNLIPEECALCGFKEKRIIDSKTPLLITFKNGKKDFTFENLELLCYNCLFLTTGAPTVANRGYIAKSFTDPDSIPEEWQVSPKPRDNLELDSDEPDDTAGGFADIQEEILRELGRN